MSNRLLIFSLIALLFPLTTFFFFNEIKSYFEINISPVGQVIQIPVLDISQPSYTLVPQSKAKILFVGDVLLARNVEFLLNSKGFDYSLKNTSAIFKDADFVVGNFESAILKNHKQTPSFVTTFSVDAKFLPLLPKAKFTHFSLANNHALDYGQETFNNTQTKLNETGLSAFGHPQFVSSTSVTVIDIGEYSVGILALNEVFSTLVWDDILTQLESLVNVSDYQIVYIHWGEEYTLRHNQKQELLAKKLIDNGVDAIIGHHPHVTQDIEVYNNKPIFYSLGNFLFDQYFSVDVQQGLAVTLHISTSSVEYELVPVSSEGARSQPYKMSTDQASIFLANLARRSSGDYVQNIKNGKLILPLSLATSSESVIIAQ